MWSEREIEAYKENVLELMAHLKMTEMKKNVPEEQEEISQSYYLEAPERGFWYPAVKEAGQIIKKGELLGQLKSMDGTPPCLLLCRGKKRNFILYGEPWSPGGRSINCLWKPGIRTHVRLFREDRSRHRQLIRHRR